MPKAKYVPILKLKKGEIEALKNLTERQATSILPLFELVEEDDEYALMNSLDNFNLDHFYIDTSYIDNLERDLLLKLMDENQTNEKKLYPVLYFDDLPEIADKVLTKCSRILYRIPVPEDIIDGPVYSEMIDKIIHWKENKGIVVDLMLDINIIRDKKEANILFNELKNLLNDYLLDKDFYEHIILAMTSFPTDLSTLPAGESWFVERLDIKLFKVIYQNPKFTDIKEKFLYADYGVTRFTDSEIDFSKLRNGILPKAKYTTKDNYWILKGKRDKITRTMIMNHTALAKEIYESDQYYGEHFSFGDLDIKKRALKDIGPGNNTQWVTIAANHHIAVVVDELSKIYGF